MTDQCSASRKRVLSKQTDVSNVKKNYAFIGFPMMLNWLLMTLSIGCFKCEWILNFERLWSECSGQLGRSCRSVKTNNISASSFSQFLNHPISNWIEPALEGNKVEPLSFCFCLGKLQTINSALALSPWCKFRRKDDTRLVYAWPPINTWCFLAAHVVAKTKHAALMSMYYDFTCAWLIQLLWISLKHVDRS